MRKQLLTSVLIVVGTLSASSAVAEVPGVAATIDGSWGNVAGVPVWTTSGAVNVPLDWNGLSIEGNLGSAGAGKPGIYAHLFNGGGSIVWSPSSPFRIAASVNYNQFKAEGLTLDETQYGAGGEWFATPWLTLSVGGGGVGGKVNGGYVGGDIKGYWTPDLAFDGFVNYLSGSISSASGHVTDFGVHAEWLPSEEVPLSFGARYDHFEGSAGVTGFGSASGSTDAFFVTLKFYLNDSPATTLEDRQRTGTLDTIRPSILFVPS